MLRLPCKMPLAAQSAALMVLLLGTQASAQDHARDHASDQPEVADHRPWNDDGGNDDDWSDEPDSPWQPLGGFAELASGRRLQNPAEGTGRETLQEARLRVEGGYANGRVTLAAKADLVYDGLLAGWDAEVRDLHLRHSPGERWDLKAGRQVLTWGTGDYLFLNDLFPKDWQSFFSGRDDEYLKSPADALKVSWYGDHAGVDLVWMPEFEPDTYLTGERFSFFVPQTGDTRAPQPPLSAASPTDDTWAARLFTTQGANEWALYAYRGYNPQPLARGAQGEPRFPRLDVYGASLLRPLGTGLVNLELAYHHSREDGRGDNPAIPNSQWRALVGYQQELISRLTLGAQYYLEWTEDYAALRAASPMPELLVEEYRHLLTLRLNYRMLRDKITLGLFTFYSPSDRDYHLRPQLQYRVDDHWQVNAGANLFGGADTHSFFGQLEENSNLYLRLRYRF